MTNKKKTGYGRWVEEQMKDPLFRMILARENLIEDFLSAIERHMRRNKISREALAKRLHKRVSHINAWFTRRDLLLADDMSDIAHHLGLSARITLEKSKIKR